MQVGIEREIRLDLAVSDNGIRFIALVHFDAVGVKFVFLERNRGIEGVSLRLCFWRVAAAGVHIGLDLFDVGATGHAQSFKDRSKLTDRLVRASYDLLGDGRTFF